MYQAVIGTALQKAVLQYQVDYLVCDQAEKIRPKMLVHRAGDVWQLLLHCRPLLASGNVRFRGGIPDVDR